MKGCFCGNFGMMRGVTSLSGVFVFLWLCTGWGCDYRTDEEKLKQECRKRDEECLKKLGMKGDDITTAGEKVADFARAYESFFNESWLKNGGKVFLKVEDDKENYIELKITDVNNEPFDFYVRDISSICVGGASYGIFDKGNKRPEEAAHDISKVCIVSVGKGASVVSNMRSMFSGCKSLASIEGLNLVETSNVTDMSCMFYKCSSLTTLPDISKWNTSKVTSMYGMFYECERLKYLDLTKWDVKNVSNSTNIFYGCVDLSVGGNGSLLKRLFKRDGIEDDKVYNYIPSDKSYTPRE